MSDQNRDDEVTQHLSWGAITFIERPSSKVLAFALFSLVLGAVIFLALSTIFKIDISVKVSGQINSIYGIKIAQVSRDGIIEQILVANGDLVRKEQVIAKLKIQGSSELELESVKKNIKFYLGQIQSKKVPNKIVVPWPSKVSDSPLRSQFVDCEKKLSNYLYLRSIGLQNVKAETEPISQRLEFLDQQLTRIKSSRYRDDLLMQKYTIQDEVGRLKTQLATIENGMRLKLQEAEIEIERSLENTLAFLELFLEAHFIKAPVDGKVLRFQQFIGSNIKAGDAFANLVEDSSPLVAEVLVPSRDISRVKESANVWVSIDAYPRNKYGYFKGKVISIEKLKSSVVSAKASTDEMGYLAKISIDLDDYRRNPASAKKKVQLIPGMKVDVQIVWKKTSLMGLFKSNFVSEDD